MTCDLAVLLLLKTCYCYLAITSVWFVLQCECDYRFRVLYYYLLAIPEVCLIPDTALSLSSRILKEMNLFFLFGFMLSLLNIVLCKRFEVNQIKCLGK